MKQQLFQKMEEDELPCSNCQNMFAAAKIELHQAYCRRNIHKCKFCSLMVDVNDQETHNNEYHALKPCPYCQVSFSQPEMILHQSICSSRPIQCHFCQYIVAFKDMVKHKKACLSRTILCQICRKYIKISLQEEHMIQCRGPQMRRNESYQEIVGYPNRIIRNRMNSNQHIKKQFNELISPRMPKLPVKKQHIIIEPQIISQYVDPVPLSIRLAQRAKQLFPKRTSTDKKCLFQFISLLRCLQIRKKYDLSIYCQLSMPNIVRYFQWMQMRDISSVLTNILQTPFKLFLTDGLVHFHIFESSDRYVSSRVELGWLLSVDMSSRSLNFVLLELIQEIFYQWLHLNLSAVDHLIGRKVIRVRDVGWNELVESVRQIRHCFKQIL